jgi:hypothetical protein
MNINQKYIYKIVPAHSNDLTNYSCALQIQYNVDYPDIDFKKLCAEREIFTWYTINDGSFKGQGGSIPIRRTQQSYIDSIMSEYNDEKNNILSQEGSCFIGNNASVSPFARIRDNAKVYQTSSINGRTLLYNNAVVTNSKINDKSSVTTISPDKDYMTCIISDNTYINNAIINTPEFNDTHILHISGYSYINNVHIQIRSFTNKIINWQNITINVDKSLFTRFDYQPVWFYFNNLDDLNLINFNFNLNTTDLKIYRKFCIEHGIHPDYLFGENQTENLIAMTLVDEDGSYKTFYILLTDFINNFN